MFDYIELRFNNSTKKGRYSSHLYLPDQKNKGSHNVDVSKVTG